MKSYEIVVHNIGGRYENEVYHRDSRGNLFYVHKDEADKIANNYPDKTIYELHHSADYQKVKSPFTNQDGSDLYLFGRYINISSRISDRLNRF